ncbi:nucleotidyltransferase [Paenibacillus beijingensis]|uniref:tRNA(Met) cytidine acetate ligase n=1 Tax=Paenibacillus beijingensis TaxID=1126833 RepID=A0A0D5NML3_9BACL|nr:nucleotidyltransferase [Paenibacillus beijingensis]AJY76521.1 nucleotidyltransferase [Paenibacillus beijingensis]
MRTVGIIVEYNPFHNGHAYHIQKSLQLTGAEAVVAVMSGHFLQRGEPALMNKWARAETALRGGCDLVIELPLAYSIQAADWFAYGAVSLLEATGVVDSLCFGSESGDIAPLQRLARALQREPDAFKSMLDEALAAGAAYPAAYSAAAARYMLEAEGDSEAAAFPLAQPNNTLGLHYLLALERLGSAIEPCTIRREQAGYHDRAVPDGSGIASATAIRRLLLETGSMDGLRRFVPDSTERILAAECAAGRAPRSWDDYFAPLLHAIVTGTPRSLGAHHEWNEGLEHRLLAKLPHLKELRFETLLESLKTKRYTRTKLQRALLSLLLGLHKEDLTPQLLRGGVEYIRVLGFTGRGRRLLAAMRSKARLPIVMSAARAAADYHFLELDTRATAVYASAYPDAGPQDLLRDYYERPVIVDSPQR